MRGPRWTPIPGVALLAVALGACISTHGDFEEYRRAVTSAYGDSITFWIRMDPEGEDMELHTAELLEVRDSAFLIAFDRRILYVALERIARPEIEFPRQYRIRARYPNGLTETQLLRLIEAAGAERVDTLDAFRSGDAPPATPRGGAEAGPADDDTAPGPDTLEVFLLRVEAAAAPFQSLELAVASGYRRLGPSFPGMGEHWIHPGLIVEGRVDPDRPPVLCYARVDGEPRLVAVAFAVPLEGDEAPPRYPAGRSVWHDHSDEVDEETLLLSHPASSHGTDGPRLAMFHAWLWLDNPDGILAQNNWRLPFLRAGLDPEGIRPSADAARALALHSTGPPYYLELFRRAGRPGDAETAAIGEILAEYARAARDLTSDVQPPAAVGPHHLAGLEKLWRDLWNDMSEAVRPETWHRLTALR